MTKYIYLITSIVLLSVLVYSYFDYLRLLSIEKDLYQEHNQLKIKNKIYKISKYKQLQQYYIQKNEQVFKIVLPEIKKSKDNFFMINWKIFVIFFIVILGFVAVVYAKIS